VLTTGLGLGPVVASLSLGSSATMSWRPKTRRFEPNAPFLLGHEEAIKQRPTIPATALSITLSHGVSDLLSPAKPIPAAPNCTL
jgi:hypothetical protein